ncbi:MAG: trigger factor [Propionibacteriaceae bacterium]|nr:trigger factor [Propionibacteriaceae bacterium]
MPSTIERLSPTRVKLTLEITAADFKPALDKAYRAIAAQITLPGFRKGKVPPAIIDQRLGRETVLNEAVNSVLPDAYGAAIVEHGLAPLGQPEIEAVTLEPGQDAVFTAEVDVRPDFDLPDLASLAVTVAAATVDDASVEERVAMLRERFAETAPVDRAAAVGDQVTISLVGTQDGVELPDATASDLPYVIGSGELVDGLDEAVIGLQAGESAVFSSTLLGGPHKGETADITVDVTQVAERILPEADDDFAQLVSQFDTVAEMRADLRQGAAREALIGQAEAAQSKLLDTLVAATPFDLPEGLVAREVETRTDQINQSLQRAGLSLSDYLAQASDGKTAEDFWAELATEAEQSLRRRIVIDKLVEELRPTVSENDLTQFVMRQSQERGWSPQDMLDHMKEHDHLAEWMTEIRRAKAVAALLLQAKVIDEDGRAVDLSPVLATSEEPAEDDAAAGADDDAEPLIVDIDEAAALAGASAASPDSAD